MPDRNPDRHEAVFRFVLNKGGEVQSWPGTAAIIAEAIEVALSFEDRQLTNSEVTA